MKTGNSQNNIESTMIWYDSSKTMPEKPSILIGIYCVEDELIPFPLRFLEDRSWKSIDGMTIGCPAFWAERSIPLEISLRSPCR
jgi:hypothetical protein